MRPYDPPSPRACGGRYLAQARRERWRHASPHATMTSLWIEAASTGAWSGWLRRKGRSGRAADQALQSQAWPCATVAPAQIPAVLESMRG
ncbi:hypothetical protein AoKodu_25050 [Actinomyces oris K20]|nr:hypothetical protein AoKodu_25050 [Actinomyces oris K20]